jgi:hypothetical protein
MKRTAGAFIVLAGLGGCLSADKTEPATGHFGRVGHTREASELQGPYGQPVTPVSAVARGQSASSKKDSGLKQAGVFSKENGGHHGGHLPPAPPAAAHGIPPVPFQGPPGAVAAIGALVNGQPTAPSGQRTEIRFAGPAGMNVSWLAPSPTGGTGFLRPGIDAPGRYNFLQGGVYRLKLSAIPGQKDTELYPTLEVLPATHKTNTFLAHSSVPVNFTDEDFQQVAAGNFVVKVIYLPDPAYQDLAAAGIEEVVSSRLEPGVDPIAEAQRRGSILAIVRLGNIHLELPNTPAMDAPRLGGMMPSVNPGLPSAPTVTAPKPLPLTANSSPLAPSTISPPLAPPSTTLTLPPVGN